MLLRRLEINATSFIPHSRYNPAYYNEIEENELYNPRNNNSLTQENNINSKSLDYLLSTPQITNSNSESQEESKNKLSIIDLHKKNINELKEKLIYYFSSPESLLHYKSCLEEEIKFDFYRNLDCENFLTAQNERFKQILSISNLDLNTKTKISKLSNFNNSFCPKASIIKNNNEANVKALKNANLIGIKMDEGSFLYTEQEIDEGKILIFLEELKENFRVNSIDMESLGLIQINFIEKNLISILKIIENKFLAKKNVKNLTSFTNICINILKSFKSTKLLFYIIQLLKQNKDNLDFNQLNSNKDQIHFIPNNCFDFEQLDRNVNKLLIRDLRKPLLERGIIKNDLNEIQNLDGYITLNYDNYILIFFGVKNENNLNEEKIEFHFYYYLKIDFINKNIIDIGKINLLNEQEEKNENIIIIDINFSIKNEFIYLFYIINNGEEYSIKYKIFKKYFLNLVKEGEFKLKNFTPINLYIDNKYLYCTSDNNKIFIIKRNFNLDQIYINCSFRLYENNLLYYTEINDISSYEMYNSLCVKNLFILNNKTNKKKFIAKLIIQKNNNYLLNIYEMQNKSDNDKSLKISYNEGIFIIIKIDINEIYYDMTSNNFNNFIDKGISLLPFNTKISNYDYSDNLYEYLIQEYSSYLNLCGNFELINAEKEKNLIKNPFSLCCNFDKNIFYSIIENIIENIDDNITFNYIIILKQMICSFYNFEIFKEEMLEKIIPFFKKLIFNSINGMNKISLKKLLNEIMGILQYMNNNTIVEIDEIKFVFDENYQKITKKSKFLLIELLMKQNSMKKSSELFEYIIKLEKNYLMDLFQKENLDISNYYLWKQLMINASESLYKGVKYNKRELINLLPFLSENINELFKIYQSNTKNNTSNIDNFSFLYNSFIFRSFFLIIEYLLANKIILGLNEYIIPLYKTLLILDKKNIYYNDLFDMDNVIEIINNSLYIEDRENFNLRYYGDNKRIHINLKDPKDLIIKTNLISDKDFDELNNSIIIQIITKNSTMRAKFLHEKEQIYNKVEELDIDIRSMNSHRNRNEFKINIIPLKNEKLYNLYKNNKDNKIISLIEKCIIQYLLFFFEDFNNKIEKYNSDRIIKNQRKIFQLEIFKFLSFTKNISITNNIISQSQFIDKTNKLLEELYEIIGSKENFNKLNDGLLTKFNIINKEIGETKFDFKKYENTTKNIPKENKKIINISNIEKYNKIFKIFESDLSKNNFNMNQMNRNKDLNELINKIFLFGIKYYNYFSHLNNFTEQIEKMKIETIEDIKKNINKIRLLDNYSIFYSFYEESAKIKSIYHKHKSNFKDLNFDEENKKFFNDNNEKINFLFDYIIPCDDYAIKPNTIIIKNLIEVIDNYNIGINEIIQNSQLQNINSQIKLIELSIINNLLIYINDESNIILILNFICKKMRHSYNILNSIFDDIYGADYYNIEKLKYKFHLFLKILLDKTINKQNKYSIITKISLTESLIWRIKKRNFSILSEMMEVFEDLKVEKKIDNKDYLFNFENNNNYNIKYYNEKKNAEHKFEVFKILVYQIMNIIKNFLKFQNENKINLSLERNPSTILEIDFKKIFEKIMTYFVDINPQCIFYDDLILFFYKIFNNSDIFLDYILNNYPNIIKKILEISLDINNSEKNFNTKARIYTRLIMIKLLCQIIEKIEDFNLEELSTFLPILENQNILNFLFDKLIRQLKDDNKNKNIDIIIYKYYINLSFICLNKIFELEKDDKNIQKLINNENTLKVLFYSDNLINLSENQFIIKSENNSNNFENIALFNKENNNPIKIGTIICFLGDKNYDDLNYTFERYNNKNLFNSLNDSSFLYDSYNKNNKFNNALIIMKDSEQLDFYNVSNIELKNINELEMINTESRFKKKFFENNYKLIIDIIIKKLANNELNLIELYLMLKSFSQLIKYIKKDDLILLIKYLWNFYDKNKSEEDNYPFMSLEFIEKEINKYFNIYDLQNKNIDLEDNNDSLFSLFNYSIKDRILKINRNHIINKNFEAYLMLPIIIEYLNEENDKIKRMYEETYKLSNLSFFKAENDNIYKIINDNSILFTQTLSKDSDLKDITEQVKLNLNKIRVIIVNEISNNIDQKNLCNFLENYGIPIYIIDKSIYQKIIEFFVRGQGYENIFVHKNNQSNKKDNYNIFTIFKLRLNKNSKKQEENTPIENIIKAMPKNKLNKIKNNPVYKTKLCRNYKYGNCDLGNRCDFAHGRDEKEEIQFIREYLWSRNEKNEKLTKYENNRNNLYKELKNEYKNLFIILNIKLSERLLFDILNLNSINLSEIENIFKDIDNIANIYEILCLEYYFNLKYNISSELLKEKIPSFFKKLLDENGKSILDNKLILNFFKNIEKANLRQNFFNIDDFNLRH